MLCVSSRVQLEHRPLHSPLFVTCSTNIKVEGRRACEWQGREERGGEGEEGGGGEERKGEGRRGRGPFLLRKAYVVSASRTAHGVMAFVTAGKDPEEKVYAER